MVDYIFSMELQVYRWWHFDVSISLSFYISHLLIEASWKEFLLIPQLLNSFFGCIHTALQPMCWAFYFNKYIFIHSISKYFSWYLVVFILLVFILFVCGLFNAESTLLFSHLPRGVGLQLTVFSRCCAPQWSCAVSLWALTTCPTGRSSAPEFVCRPGFPPVSLGVWGTSQGCRSACTSCERHPPSWHFLPHSVWKQPQSANSIDERKGDKVFFSQPLLSRSAQASLALAILSLFQNPWFPREFILVFYSQNLSGSLTSKLSLYSDSKREPAAVVLTVFVLSGRTVDFLFCFKIIWLPYISYWSITFNVVILENVETSEKK